MFIFFVYIIVSIFSLIIVSLSHSPPQSLTTTNDRQCTNNTLCLLGSTFQTTSPTLTSNRVCSAVKICNLLQYELTPPTLLSDRYCNNITVCVDGVTYELTSPNTTSDRVCRVYKSCNYMIEYEVPPLSLIRDRNCTLLTVCTTDQVMSINQTRYSGIVYLRPLIFFQ